MLGAEFPSIPIIKETIRSLYLRNKSIASKSAETRSLREVKILFRGTGGGSAVGQWLLTVSGASSTVLGIAYPYHRNALARALGGSPPVHGYCSQETCLALSRSARDEGKQIMSEDIGFDLFHKYHNSNKLSKIGESGSSTEAETKSPIILGVGFTGVLASESPHKGEHRGYVGLSDSEGRELVHKVVLEKGLRSREEEDDITSYLVIQAIINYVNFYAFEIDGPAPSDKQIIQLPLKHIQDLGGIEYSLMTVVNTHEEAKRKAIESLILGDRDYALFWPKGNPNGESVLIPHFPISGLRKAGKPVLILCGSFNPLHVGHERMALAAMKKFNQVAEIADTETSSAKVVFEISVNNADKGGISIDTVAKRMLQFTDEELFSHGPWPVVATTVPKFVDKARLFPGCLFVVGMDTAVRIINPKYYNNSEEEMLEALIEIKRLCCSFVVAGRINSETNAFETFHEMHDRVPTVIRSIFHPLSEEEFRIDLSSTEMRQRMKSEGKANM